jgi:hypothetical protein
MICKAYVNKDVEFLTKKHGKSLKEIWPGNTLADRLNWAIHQETHKWSYDYETLKYRVLQAGCKNIEPLTSGRFYGLRDHECGLVVTK